MTQMENGFCIEVTWKNAQEILKFAEEKNKDIFLITEWGAVGNDNAKFVVDISDEDCKKCYFATVNMLQKSKDGVFVTLKRDGKEQSPMPNFEDIFEMRELP